MAPIGSVLLAPSPSSNAKYDLTYYLKAAAAGGICCSITHGALTPVDGTFFARPVRVVFGNHLIDRLLYFFILLKCSG